MTTSDIRSLRFRAEREKGWKRLDELITTVEKRGHSWLRYSERAELCRLYSEASHALSVAREVSLDAALRNYLEALVARGYFAVHAAPQPVGGLAKRFFQTVGPSALCAIAPFIALAALVMALGGLAAAALFSEDQSWYYTFMPADLSGGRNPSASTEYLREVIYPQDAHDGLSAFAGYLFSNNARVAIFAFGLGLLGVAPAMLILFYNGLILGAFVALHVERGLGWDIFAWLSIHGVTELGAIVVAGGAGMAVGWAGISPGRNTRGAAMREAGHGAVPAVVVALLMLLAAAVLEGFGRQLIQSLEMRLLIGWGIGLLWLGWALSSWRRPATQDHTT